MADTRNMNHPEQILRTFDEHLQHATRLILYGRAALALGYPDAPDAFHTTMDVDAILPEVEMAAIEADDGFWTAIEKTNQELLASGLYITHLFSDRQLIIRPCWLDRLVPVPMQGLSLLVLQRPSTEDLILTKMMRIDPQDRSDIHFLLTHSNINTDNLENFLNAANIPDIAEIQEAFQANCQWLRTLFAVR